MQPFKSVFQKGKVLIPYITFGDPDMSKTESLILDCFDAGADIVELGIPFSDPVADGPVIQSSHYRVLSSQPQISVADVFAVVQSVRKKTDRPIVLMTTVNLIINYGIEAFFKDAATAQVSGVVIPDLSVEDADDYRLSAKRFKLPIIFLVSPTVSDDRLRRIVRATGGFLYLISAAGTTGARETFANNLTQLIAKIRRVRSIPIAIGFGVSRPEQADQFWQIADGVIVGSHFVNIFNQNADHPSRISSLLQAEIRSFK